METCRSTHISLTANGDVEVRCTKSADHVDQGDKWHEGKIGFFPVRWEHEEAESGAV